MNLSIIENLPHILEGIKDIAKLAGLEILKYYSPDTADTTEMGITYKENQSPLTKADTAANEIITPYLRKIFPTHAILSEEEKDNLSRLDNNLCWIVDPLDGTKEFIKKNGEFTVNIALSLNHKIILGVIYAPILDELYYAAKNFGCYLESSSGVEKLQVSSNTKDLVLVSSRSHKSEKLLKLIDSHQDRIKSDISKGSSLKGCLIARGDADIYYRFGYTMEWDTAAMQCIVEEARGIFRQMDDSEMLYNRENSLNEKGFYILNSTHNALHSLSENNLNWHHGQITRQDRLQVINNKNFALWFTGLSGSGKSTIAAQLEQELFNRGKLVYRLDGDNIRHGLNADLGFSVTDREENLRRIIEVARLFQDAGVITLISFISPFRKSRDLARQRLDQGKFFEIYVKASLDTCKERDPKGMYKKALAGEIRDFTGIDAIYEESINPELILDTDKYDLTSSVQLIINMLEKLVLL